MFLGYACATLGGAIIFLALTTHFAGVHSDMTPSEWISVFGFIAVVAAIYALPIALPAIAFTEIRQTGSWLKFAIAGLILGLALAALFTEVPYRGINIQLAATMIASSLCGAMTYWLIAWCVLSPNLDSQRNRRLRKTVLHD